MTEQHDSSLSVIRRGELFFSHNGNWLHPLFELEQFLSVHDTDPAELEVTDKIVGKAAAMLMVRMGLGRIHAITLSEPGLNVFHRFGVPITYDHLVPLIDCQTEKILSNIDDPEEASVFLLRRGKRDVDASLIVESLYVSRDGRTILENLSFAVTRGERVIIRGDNGSGKTTFLESILGTVRAHSGHIEIAGMTGKRLSPETVGYLGQYTAPGDIAITAREVLSLGALRWKRHKGEEAGKVKEAVEITGIGSLLERPMNTLSGGERRRVDLARCFIQTPGLLLLDEPTANLDEGARKGVLDILNAYAGLHRSAIVMVTHDSSAFDLPGWRYHHLENGRLSLLSAAEGRRNANS